MKLRPQSAGWAGPPGLSGCGCHTVDAFCYRLGGKRRRNWWGGRWGKIKSNAMSHSALAAGVGDRERWGSMRRGEDGEYFCMLYEARRHMPSELGCLLSQSSWFDRPVLAPPYTPKAKATPPPITVTLLPLTLLRMKQWVRQLLWLCMDCRLSICVCVVGEGGTQWSEHIGHCRESRQEQLVSWREGWEWVGIRRGKKWEAVRYTDNGIRLKHSVGERPLLSL